MLTFKFALTTATALNIYTESYLLRINSIELIYSTITLDYIKILEVRFITSKIKLTQLNNRVS